MSVRKPLQNQRGQGLIEYLIIVALMSVAAIAIVRTVSQSLNARFAEVAFALQGKKKSVTNDTIDESTYKKKDLGDFIDGVASKDGGGSGSGSGSGGGR
jgi:pilus assembly protein Flp/PilA